MSQTVVSGLSYLEILKPQTIKVIPIDSYGSI